MCFILNYKNFIIVLISSDKNFYYATKSDLGIHDASLYRL